MDNFEKAFDVAAYMIKHLRNELDATERVRLQHWMDEKDEHKALFEKLTSEQYLLQQLRDIQSFNTEAAYKRFLQNKLSQTPVISARKNSSSKWWMAAAGFFLVAASFAYFLLIKESPKNKNQLLSQVEKPIEKDAPPGGNKALLTLSDGSVIKLDDASNGTISTEGNIKVIKLPGGKLAYEKANGEIAEMQYNTVTTPIGGKYQLVLADGTQVWLNASSSITFPTYFSESDREVKVNGEVYFEVFHDQKRPFIVKTDKAKIEVLGTSFNLSAYKNDEETSTTLVNGSVKISDENESVEIRPGEQAQIRQATDKILVVKNVNLEAITAWKNGKFNFFEEDIHSIMRKLERWYGITATFQNNVTREKFVGVISRDVKLSQILKMLEKTGVVSFTSVGKNVIVK